MATGASAGGGGARPSKAEQVRGLLMADIMAGRLPPGEKLVEEDIAARLRCSRTPVREALRHLDAIGLIKFRPHHGATVASPGQGGAADVLDALAELESALAELAAGRMTEDHRQRLRAPASEESVEETLLEALYAAAGNPVLVELAITVRSRLALRPGQANAAGGGDPGPVIDALLAGEGQAARAAMRAHVLALGRRDS